MKLMLRMIPMAAALIAAAASVQAQTPANRSVVAVPQRPAPTSFSAPTPGPSAPVAAGLRSPAPNPGGLTSQFPAGLPSPSPFPAGLPTLTTPLASPNTVSAQTGAGIIVTPVGDGTVLMPSSAIGGLTQPAQPAQPTQPTQNMGAAAAPGASSAGPGPYTALQMSQAFQAADSNRDGDLTRAEAQRLSIMTVGFDDMDRNKNGLISRSEFEDSTR